MATEAKEKSSKSSGAKKTASVRSVSRSSTTVRKPVVSKPAGMTSRPVQNRQVMNNNHNNRRFDGHVDGRTIPDAGVPVEVVSGILDLRQDGAGVLREAYKNGVKDAYISASQVRRFKLRPGDVVAGPARKPKDNERFWGFL